ncbi:MAG: 16S rRNA (cytidine(1402)-2'-O)-methyltransferase [Phyllobacteriaceae bacterium]|nr:16S rRNA (cytidine(1402)-2'-O)-methyltransferase [Phyllobacteriaceae bacterium]
MIDNSDPRTDGRGYGIGAAAFRAPPLEPALYVVATPIGNLRDVTIRALETLAGADIVAAEDTRVTRILLDRYAIARKPVAYHDHNAEAAGPRLIQALKTGKSVALVSDAGTPLVSDPGYRLVEQALAAGVRVIPIPGASAVLSALVATGLPTDAFLFAGFPPVKDGARRSRFEALAATPATLVFYESPHRLAESLAALAEALGPERPAGVAREMTKTFEEVRRGTLRHLADHYAAAGEPKGEIVIVVAPPPPATFAATDIDALLASLVAEMPASRAAAEAARMTGRPKGDLYKRLLELKGGSA